MEDINFDHVYKIDEERLYKYYERIKNQFGSVDSLKAIAKFLNNQSIGSSFIEVSKILNYYKIKLKEKLLDFAFEWIRAQKVRLEYKKFLVRAQFPNDELAVDECIFLFFLEFDNYLRRLFNENIKEFEISALYEVFLIPYETKSFDIDKILEKHRNKVPTIFKETKRTDTSIFTLRCGLSDIIKNDYETVRFARKEERKMKELKPTSFYDQRKIEVAEFNGTLLERKIKSYCFKKEEMSSNDIESAVSSFLSSYFKFGTFYKYEDYEENLVKSLAEYINSGLTENLKNQRTINSLKSSISELLTKFRAMVQTKELDGTAWVNDLKPVLKDFVTQFINNLF